MAALALENPFDSKRDAEWRRNFRFAESRRMELREIKSTSRHGLVRNLTVGWMTKEDELREEMESIVSERDRLAHARKMALWKSWVYHVVTPIASTLHKHFNKKYMKTASRRRRNLYQKYIDYANDTNRVIKLDFYRPEVYDPFVLRKSRCLRLGFREPILNKWKDTTEEKEFLDPDWPFETKAGTSSDIKNTTHE